MIRGKRAFFLAIMGSIVGFTAGLYLLGVGHLQYMTSSGIVDMTDAKEVSSAMADPTFTATFSLGSFTLSGVYWPLILPLGCALTGIVLALVYSRRANHRNSEE